MFALFNIIHTNVIRLERRKAVWHFFSDNQPKELLKSKPSECTSAAWSVFDGSHVCCVLHQQLSNTLIWHIAVLVQNWKGSCGWAGWGTTWGVLQERPVWYIPLQPSNTTGGLHVRCCLDACVQYLACIYACMVLFNACIRNARGSVNVWKYDLLIELIPLFPFWGW